MKSAKLLIVSRPIRVTFVEPSLAQYRVPFFRVLAAQPDLRVKLFYANSGRPNATPDGFDATYTPRDTYRLRGHPIYWQQSQLDAANRESTDVVSFDWDIHYASLVPALLKAKREGVATILWGHGTSKHDGTWKAWPRRTLARLADVIVTYSEPARASYIAAGWPADRAFCAPNAIDQSQVQAAYAAVRSGHADETSARIAARGPLLFDDDDDVLLFVSRLDPNRRLDVVIDAIALLAPIHPRLHLAIVGAGPERPRVEKHAADKNVLERLVFAGAEYDETRLARWYLASDLVVHPAGLGLSVYHAMGHGRPMISGDDPGSHGPEAASVEHGVTGLRFASNDARACAAAIEQLLADGAARQTMGVVARHRALHDHSIDTMVERFAAAIRAAAARRY